MIFSELYSVYYNTVAKILMTAMEPGTREADLQQIVMNNAFSESVLAILPALKSEKWQLLEKDGTPVIHHSPTIPLTTLEKRWLKSLEDDPRLKLFDVKFPDLGDMKPLFTRDDYKIYDQYEDGDPFEDEDYIRKFRLIQEAIQEQKPVKVILDNRKNNRVWMRFYPIGFEYSQKDDKIRVKASKCRYRYVNLGRIQHCNFYTGEGSWREKPVPECPKQVVLEITDERNALERVMLHFAHFEKQAERLDENRYLLKITYYESDETEMVIRVLSFGSFVRVIEPDSFVNLIKERLLSQKICGLK